MADKPSGDAGVDADTESVARVERTPSSSASGPARHPGEKLLPQVSSDERPEGWGEGSDGYSDDWYLSERPPHHG